MTEQNGTVRKDIKGTVTDVGSNLTQPRSADVHALTAMRTRHGADSPIGHRCSNLIELLGCIDAPGDNAGRLACLENCICQQLSDLYELTR